MSALTQRLNKKMNKKISFHRGSEQPSIEFTTSKVAVKKKRKWTANRKKINRKKYKVKVKKKKQEKIRALVDKIKDNNVVVNLSNVDIPDAAYLFLSKGLGYIPSTKVDPHDLTLRAACVFYMHASACVSEKCCLCISG